MEGKIGVELDVEVHAHAHGHPDQDSRRAAKELGKKQINAGDPALILQTKLFM